jgi:hypothetical protein
MLKRGFVFLALAGVLAGCSNNAVLDQAPLRNFVVVTIRNDLPYSISVARCLDVRCTKEDVTDNVSPSRSTRMAVNNATSGSAIFRLERNGRSVGCLFLRYRRDERAAELDVSHFTHCP